ncbi:MAG: nuclear transport factor 2 family protein [Novosphingobium sp.]|nr:nuclear transport factor 2 family protein [Novosphingobium sp.]
MTVTVSQISGELADRETIKDCLFRYSRGIDRADEELLASVYWPGAMDYHTGFAGTAEEFIAWSMPRLAALEDKVHMLGNIFIRLNRDTAKAETYFWSVSVAPGDEPRQILACGRYLDKFEKRADEWRIAERFVVHDWFNENTDVGDWSVGPFGMAGLERGTQLAQDKSGTWLGLD